MLTNSSKEYTLVTYYHECIHAYVDYYRYLFETNHIDSSEFIQKLPLYWDIKRSLKANELVQHTIMSTQYITEMKDIIQAFNSNVPDSVATALAWGGLQGTTVWKYLPDTTSIIRINNNARGMNGNAIYNSLNLTKCP